MRILLSILFLFIIINFTHRIYFNVFTHSLPQGVYRRVEGTPQRGDYAATCLTAPIAQYGIHRGYLAPGQCPTGTVLVLKIIKGIPGDQYARSGNTLVLNGVAYTLDNRDSFGRPLKIFYKKAKGVLGQGKYLLISTFVKNSWDSRYWGPVSIEFLLKPLILW